MRTVIVRQIDLKDGCKHIMLHEFLVPEFDDNGFYRTAVSLNAFFFGTKKRNWSEKYLFVKVYEFDVPSDYEIERDKKLPIKIHKDLLAFFEHIGYDRKKKKIKDIH